MKHDYFSNSVLIQAKRESDCYNLVIGTKTRQISILIFNNFGKIAIITPQYLGLPIINAEKNNSLSQSVRDFIQINGIKNEHIKI